MIIFIVCVVKRIGNYFSRAETNTSAGSGRKQNSILNLKVADSNAIEICRHSVHPEGFIMESHDSAVSMYKEKTSQIGSDCIPAV